jgi:MSHA biogenesis protein MshK
LGEAKLIRLSEREAVLEGPDGVTHLYLTPNIEKQMIATPGSRKSHKTGQGKDSR